MRSMRLCAWGQSPRFAPTWISRSRKFFEGAKSGDCPRRHSFAAKDRHEYRSSPGGLATRA
jgi:hypothetical protein